MVVDPSNGLVRKLAFYWPIVPPVSREQSVSAGGNLRQIVPRQLNGLGSNVSALNGALSYALAGAPQAPLPIRSDPQMGRVVELSAAADYLVNADSTFQAISPSPWSFTGWFRLVSTTSGSFHALLSHANSGFTVINLGSDYDVSAGKFRVYTTNGSGNYKVANSSVISPSVYGRWIFLAGTCDSSSVKVYVNGRLDGTTATGANPDAVTTEWRIGKNAANIGSGVMQVRNVAVWSGRVLTAGEVANLYVKPWQLIAPVAGLLAA